MKTASHFIRLTVVVLLAAMIVQKSASSENAPHAPFAQWADLPERGQVILRAMYQESEAYHFWAGDDSHKVDYIKGGEHYGIDITQGFLALQYGLTEKWAADLTIGYTTVGWRYFSNNNSPAGDAQSTTGLSDTSLGLRYQIFKENENEFSWTPTLTFRAGAVLPGTYDQDFPFAPGNRSAAIEPEILLRKHFGWTGFGAYADGLFRWNRTTANDHYIASAGLFQKISGWELNAGYRRLGTVEGDNIQFDPDTRTIKYPVGVRENQDSVEAGFSYLFNKLNLRLGFYSRTVVAGVNTDKKFWVGGYIEMPFWIFKPAGS